MKATFHTVWVSIVSVALTGGCAGCIERLVPGKVAMGAARLTVRHAGAIAKMIDADTNCGFAADTTKRAILIQGNPGDEGAVVFQVTNCKLKFLKRTVISTSCTGGETSVEGTIIVSGRKRVMGTITGNPDSPIFPSESNAVFFEIDAEIVEPFAVYDSKSKAHLETNSGRLYFEMEPMLALNYKNNACSIPTLDVRFPKIQWKESASSIISDGSRTFPVSIDASDFSAQVGKYDTRENDFRGALSVWGGSQKLPADGEPVALDETYTAEEYAKSVACTPGLATPITYSCPSRVERIAHGVSRFSIAHLGSLVGLIEADTRCGFSSDAVLDNAQFTGTTGQLGTAKFTLQAPCVLSFPVPTPLAADCNGVVKYVQGTASITGTKTFNGVLSGDRLQPVVPDSRDPVSFNLDVRLENFSVGEKGAESAMKTLTGRLSGEVKPRVALDSRTGICSNTTSIAQISNVKLESSKVELLYEGLIFGAEVQAANLEAQTGTNGLRRNYLKGDMLVNKTPVSIPPIGRLPELDPEYDEKLFLSSFSCAPGFQFPPDEPTACSVDTALATNVARFMVLIAGTTASQINSNADCGFENTLIKTKGYPDDGSTNWLRWTAAGCNINKSGTTVMTSMDCQGGRTFLSGQATVGADRTVTGEPHKEFFIFPGIIPRSRDAVVFDLRNVVPNQFAVYSVASADSGPVAKLTLNGGLLSGRVMPAMAELVQEPNVFKVATPVATFTNIQLSGSQGVLEVGSKKFNIGITAAQVSAQNGTLNGVSNTISGSVTLSSGKTIVLAPNTPLQPDFNQQAFDASYSCTPNLKGVIK